MLVTWWPIPKSAKLAYLHKYVVRNKKNTSQDEQRTNNNDINVKIWFTTGIHFYNLLVSSAIHESRGRKICRARWKVFWILTFLNRVMQEQVRVSLCRPWRHLSEWRYSNAYSFLISELDGSDYSASGLSRFTTRKKIPQPTE